MSTLKRMARVLCLAAAIVVIFVTGPLAQEKGKVEILWLGQSATKITTPGGKVIVIDPFLVNNPKTPPQYKNLEALGTTATKVFPINPGDKLTF